MCLFARGVTAEPFITPRCCCGATGTGRGAVLALIKNVYWKIRNYYRHRGAKQTALRIKEAVRRLLFANRDVLFYVDLVEWSPSMTVDRSCPFTIHRITCESEFPEIWLTRILEQLPPEVYVVHMKKRFAKGATIWCLRQEEVLIGFLWTLVGDTMMPHYYPLIASDVHIFDGFILPQYRGQGTFTLMMTLVMERLKQMGLRRAYVEASEWNTLASRAFEKMQFHFLGVAHQRFRKGKTVVTWWVA
jgi:ribosomal protein S18 acetylase RimI-like enzyme